MRWALARDEVEVRITAKQGWAAANDKGVVVVLATELTPELVAEGMARDLVRVIQDRRKELGCEFTDRIEVGIETDSEELKASVEKFMEYLAGETLADSITPGSLDGAEATDIKVGDDHSEALCSSYLKKLRRAQVATKKGRISLPLCPLRFNSLKDRTLKIAVLISGSWPNAEELYRPCRRGGVAG